MNFLAKFRQPQLLVPMKARWCPALTLVNPCKLDCRVVSTVHTNDEDDAKKEGGPMTVFPTHYIVPQIYAVFLRPNCNTKN